MKTKIWHITNMEDNKEKEALSEAADMLINNQLVAFPTETVYGLGGNALSDEAIKKIYQAKGRPSDNPLIVHISSLEQAFEIAQLNDLAKRIATHFWPGPLTIIIPKKGNLSRYVSSLPTVALRMPNHPIALALISKAKIPIAAPSANLSGRPSPTLAKHVIEDLNGKIAGIIAGGEAKIGVESTVLDLSRNRPQILRPGEITSEDLAPFIGEVEQIYSLKNLSDAPRSPGMKYKHYAPQGELWIINGKDEDVIKKIQKLVDENKEKKIGILTSKEHREFYQADLILTYGEKRDLSSLAQNFYRLLREFDENNIELIFTEAVSFTGIGTAIMNRMLKAAGDKVLNV